MKAAELKDKVSPLDFYDREIGLQGRGSRATGWMDGGLCPFHSDSQRGNFRVHLESGAFRCFACGVGGGDIIKFVEIKESVSFLGAMKKIAAEWRLG